MSFVWKQYRLRCKEIVRVTHRSAYSYRKEDNFSQLDIDVELSRSKTRISTYDEDPRSNIIIDNQRAKYSLDVMPFTRVYTTIVTLSRLDALIERVWFIPSRARGEG